ncbi:hypothetical protein Tco_1159247 [Tanacetum coccineum]
MKINLTDPTITYTGIEKYSLYSIIDVPFVGIVYENNKKEKRAMDIDDLHKFSDATLKRVLRKISVINKEARHGIIKISLSDKDKELMALHEEKIKERLKYRDQMRRCESLVNGRQITNYMVRPERNMSINDVYEQEFEQRIMERIKERLDQFIDQLDDRMNDMMNPRRCGDHNGRRSEGEESKNPFLEDELEMGDDSFVLIGKEVTSDCEILEAMFPLLEEFSDVFPDELHDGLSPLRDGTGNKEMDKNQSKNGQNQTRDGLSAQEPRVSSKKSTKVNISQTMVNSQEDKKTLKIPNEPLMLNYFHYKSLKS